MIGTRRLARALSSCERAIFSRSADDRMRSPVSENTVRVGFQLHQLRLEIHLLLLERGLARRLGAQLLLGVVQHLHVELSQLGQLLDSACP